MTLIRKRLTILFLALLLLIPLVGAASTHVRADGGQILPSVSIGGNHFTVALKSDGTLWSWGRNHAGQLGNGSKTDSSVPVAVTMPSGVQFSAVSAGYDHVLALDTDGAVWAWGSNASGQLALSADHFSEKTVPTRINAPDGVRFCAVAAGNAFSLALDTDCRIWSWGTNACLQLGVPESEVADFSDFPICSDLLHADGRRFSRIYATDLSAGALSVSGEPVFWGVNSDYRFGLEQSSSPILPTEREYDTRAFVLTDLSFGARHTALLDSTGRVRSFGVNAYGQFGNGERSENYSFSIQKLASLEGVAAIAAGSYHTLALTSTGRLYSFGYNHYGQLGYPDPSAQQAYQPTPTEVAVGEGVMLTAIAARGATSAAIDADGFVWMWGDNTHGALGNGSSDSTPNTTPTKVGSGSTPLCLGLPPRDIVQNSYVTATAIVPAPTYTVTIPASVDFGELKQKNANADDRYRSLPIVITASGVDHLFGELQIVVSVTTESGRFELADGDYRLAYEVYSASDVPLVNGGRMAAFTADGSAAGGLRIDQSLITRSGDYRGTLIFTVEVEPIAASQNNEGRGAE